MLYVIDVTFNLKTNVKFTSVSFCLLYYLKLFKLSRMIVLKENMQFIKFHSSANFFPLNQRQESISIFISEIYVQRGYEIFQILLGRI